MQSERLRENKQKTGFSMDNIKTKNRTMFIEYVGLSVLGILSLGYLLFHTYFAKLHFYSSLIKAPIFIGEMTFLICFCLFFWKWLINPKKANFFTYVFLVYFVFVIWKIVVGYSTWGPLALRHSVLFLYPLFAVFSFSFYRNYFFTPPRILFICYTFFIIFAFTSFNNYFSLTCLALTIILINAYPRRIMKYILLASLLLVFCYDYLFDTSRTFIISNLAAGIYMAVGVLSILRIKAVYKVIIVIFFISFVSYSMIKVSDSNELGSLVAFEKLIEIYDDKIKVLNINEIDFTELELEVRLYNEKRGALNQNLIKERIKSLSDNYFGRKPAPAPVPGEEAKPASEVTSSEELQKVGVADKTVVRGRGERIPYVNSIFRIMIWKDACEELRVERPIVGFAFGKPFRSRSLEVLNWAVIEWARDGWICLHNSYIDIVYRAGIMGILMIIFILTSLLFMIVNSFKSRSLTGILLTGILINWFVAANFLEILEMPYTAIPLWSLFGLTFAYLFKNKTS